MGGLKKIFEKISKKFAELKIRCTFAIPFGNEAEKIIENTGR
jgi:hypothetical protein